MAMDTAPARVRRVAKVYPEVEAVTLDDFDIDDIRDYLLNNGTSGDRGFGRSLDDGDDFVVPSDTMNRIATLLLCGQREHAIAELHQLASEYLGRPI